MAVNGTISITDYDRAETIAKNIDNNADAMNDNFKALDSDMNNLHEEVWQSAESSNAKQRYEEIKGAFDTFYNTCKAFTSRINDAVTKYRQENKQAQASQEKVMDELPKIS